jgi:hypothetical protein
MTRAIAADLRVSRQTSRKTARWLRDPGTESPRIVRNQALDVELVGLHEEADHRQAFGQNGHSSGTIRALLPRRDAIVSRCS